MKINEVMSPHAECVKAGETLEAVAAVMRRLDVGAVPICDHDRLTGIITDRDIVIRTVADGHDPRTTPVREAMSKGVIWVFEDQEVHEAAELMEQHQIRRLPVLSREKRLIGMLALGDLAERADPTLSAEALREVSAHSAPKGF